MLVCGDNDLAAVAVLREREVALLRTIVHPHPPAAHRPRPFLRMCDARKQAGTDGCCRECSGLSRAETSRHLVGGSGSAHAYNDAPPPTSTNCRPSSS